MNSTTIARVPASAQVAGELMVKHIQAVVEQKREAEARYAEQVEARAQELEQEGLRIVDAGQLNTPTNDGCAVYEIRDWRSGTVLLHGYGAYRDMDKQWKDDWTAVDEVQDEVLQEVGTRAPAQPETPGLPVSLQRALTEWIEEYPGEAQELLHD